MPVVANISLDGLRATVTVTSITAGANVGCVQIDVENNSVSPMADAFIGSLCLDLNRTGPFFQESGPGNEGQLSGGNCPGRCLPNSDIVQMFTSQAERIDPGETGTFIICTANPVTDPLFEANFLRVDLHCQDVPLIGSICLAANFNPVTTTTTWN